MKTYEVELQITYVKRYIPTIIVLPDANDLILNFIKEWKFKII